MAIVMASEDMKIMIHGAGGDACRSAQTLPISASTCSPIITCLPLRRSDFKAIEKVLRETILSSSQETASQSEKRSAVQLNRWSGSTLARPTKTNRNKLKCVFCKKVQIEVCLGPEFKWIPSGEHSFLQHPAE